MADLQALTALGSTEAQTVTIGPLTITERFDVALASVAVRSGRLQDLDQAASAAGVPLPGPSLHETGPVYSGFWVAADMWFVEASFATHELIAAELEDALGDAASITEQTDAWVALDLAACDLAPLLERLCNVDFRAVPDGFATRTVIDHLGCYLIRHSPGSGRLFGPRSSAVNLLHAIEVAARSTW